MTKSSRQAAIAGYLKRDDGIDWKGLTDYANSMYDVRDELEVADVEDNFDIETAQKAIKSKIPYLTLRPLQINPAEFRKDLQKLQDAFIEKGVINVDEQVAKLKALDWNKLTDATIKLAGEDPTAFYEVATKEVLGEEADEDMMAVIAGLLLNVLRRYFRNLGEDTRALQSRRSQIRRCSFGLPDLRCSCSDFFRQRRHGRQLQQPLSFLLLLRNSVAV